MVANLDDFVGVNVVLNAQFARRNDAFCFVADVEKDFIAVNFDNSAFDNVTVIKRLDGGFNCGEEILSGADVIDGHRWGGRASGEVFSSRGHEVGGLGIRKLDLAALVRDSERALRACSTPGRGYGRLTRVRKSMDAMASALASKAGWDAYAAEYQRDHGADLTGFLWGPEGWHESDLRLLGPAGSLRGARVLEIGGGAAQCGTWLATTEGAHVVSFDISSAQLSYASAAPTLHLVQADAAFLPFADDSFDLIFSAHGGFAFIPDLISAFADCERVLRSGGRFVASMPHPIRWMLPDTADPQQLRVIRSYWDSEPYVEYDDRDEPVYVEHHHTLAHTLNALTNAGLTLVGIVEPSWKPGREVQWDAWNAQTAALYPRTLIIEATKN